MCRTLFLLSFGVWLVLALYAYLRHAVLGCVDTHDRSCAPQSRVSNIRVPSAHCRLACALVGRGVASLTLALTCVVEGGEEMDWLAFVVEIMRLALECPGEPWRGSCVGSR